MSKITVGRTVLYVLSKDDVIMINDHRKGFTPCRFWNTVAVGYIYPAITIRVFGGTGDKNPPVNLQVLLDGEDAYWATSRHEDAAKTPGTYHWPELVPDANKTGDLSPEVGDRVMFVTRSGPMMVVDAISDDYRARCQWFNDSSEICCAEFSLKSLVVV